MAVFIGGTVSAKPHARLVAQLSFADRTGCPYWFGTSDSEEDLAPVHPEQHQPIDQQHGCAKQQGL